MKFVRFLYQNHVLYGTIEGDNVRKIEGDIFGSYEILDEEVKLEDIKILIPVVPSKVVAVGLNYTDHAKELEMPIPDEPIIFIKPQTSVIGHMDEIIYPDSVNRLDYEAELAIVMKNQAKSISEDDANKYILGYTCLNDVTARDLQKKRCSMDSSKII